MTQTNTDTREREVYCENCGFKKTHIKIGAGEYQCRGCGQEWYQ